MQNPSSGVLSGTTSQFPSALRASRFYCQILFSLSRGANHSRYHSLIGTPHRWGRGRSSFAAHPSSAPGVLEAPSLGPGTPASLPNPTSTNTLSGQSLNANNWSHPYQKYSPKKVAKDVFGQKNPFTLLEDTSKWVCFAWKGINPC